MLQAPDRRLFLWIGGLEAFSQLLGFIGASKLPGVVLPLLQQSLLIWQVTLAYLVLNKRLDSVQVHSLSRLCHPLTALELPDVEGALTVAWGALTIILHVATLITCPSDASPSRVHVPRADRGSAAGGRRGRHRCMALTRRLSIYRGERLDAIHRECTSKNIMSSKTGQHHSISLGLWRPKVIFPAQLQ